jgi:hypothetical protein
MELGNSRSAIDRLLEISSDAVCRTNVAHDHEVFEQYPWLAALLTARNGFLTFESALEVYAINGDSCASTDLITWNFGEDSWRAKYHDMEKDSIAFAQDLFGTQFLINSVGEVLTFDPETGVPERLAPSLDVWADDLLRDFNFLTGWSLGHEWQKHHGPLPIGWRLGPKMPFIFGGDFRAENLRALPSYQVFVVRNSAYVASRGVRDGGETVWQDPLSTLD